MKTTLTIGNGFVSLSPFPDELKDQLHYWRRSLEFNEKTRKREMRSRKELLYQITAGVDQHGVQTSTLITMPGFASKCKKYVTACGWEVDVVDMRTPMPQPDIQKAMTGMRDYQLELVYNMLMSGGGVLAGTTGLGKTHIIKALCNAYSHEALMLRGTPTVVVAVPDRDITRKNYDDLCNLLPDRDVGIIMSGANKPSDDIQVITLDSLHKLDADDVGVLIVDEVHTAASDSRSEELLRFTKAYRWGVSATPDGRFDGKDTVTEGIFGPVVATFSYQDGVKSGALVPMTVLWVPAPEPSIGIDSYLRYSGRDKRYQWGVHKNANLNRMIGRIMHAIPPELQTLGIMQFTKHMEQVLRGCHYVSPDDMPEQVHAETAVDGFPPTQFHHMHPVTAKERNNTYARMKAGEIRKILSTHVWKQGVSFDDLRIVVNIGGGGSEIAAKQIPGRASRKAPGKDRAYIIEFSHDWDTQKRNGRDVSGPVKSDDRFRRRIYEELGFTQIDLEEGDMPWLTTRPMQTE